MFKDLPEGQTQHDQKPAVALSELTDVMCVEPDYSKPPCQRCGAMTEEEARAKCKVSGGDDDDCHGCHLWPD